MAAVVRKLFTFNRIAALVTVYVSNPLTVVPRDNPVRLADTRTYQGTTR